MHPAWYIDDVRLLVLHYLDPGDLARLARTCKENLDPVTDCLWRHLNTVEAFVCCLPRYAKYRQLELDDLARLDYYAPKVRTIVLEERAVENVNRLPASFRSRKQNKITNTSDVKRSRRSWAAVWANIADLRPNRLFVPNLTRIRVSNIVEELLLPFIGISGAHLNYIYIKYVHEPKSDSIVRLFLDRIHDTSQLEYLFVRDGEPDLIPINLIELSPLKQLRLDPRIYSNNGVGLKFKKLPIRPQVLLKSSLESLTLGLTREWNGNLGNLRGRYLPALKSLWLNLRTFRAEQCASNCANTFPDSWTCVPADRYGESYTAPQSAGCYDCGRRPPTLFLQNLDSPKLDVLNIKFPHEVCGEMFVGTISAAKIGCQLDELTELVLDGGGWFPNLGEWGPSRPPPRILPQDLREGISLLLPLYKLKVLQLSAGPNFLQSLDLDFYQYVAQGLPALQRVSLGHHNFRLASQVSMTIKYYEQVPLSHLAAFCCLFPNLTNVDLGGLDCTMLEKSPRMDYVCPRVTSLRIRFCVNRDTEGRMVEISPEDLTFNVKHYFPNLDWEKVIIG